jgi:crotonobetainyl-CoA:carnitine CoA-transferase CaiB-like acyl-CoA transferase
MSAPLEGTRIIAVEQFGAGPYATLQLADLGAEVIKIEDPGQGGDVGRYIPPGQIGTDSLYFEAFNRNKRSLKLDLKQPSGRAVFERLAAISDAVFNNLRGDQPKALGLTYAALQHVNPKLVCASLSAYGQSGPRQAYGGYDALVQAEAGWAAITGEPGAPPTKSGLSMVDYAAGLMAALGLTVGLLQARATGKGGDVDTNLYDVAVSLLTYPAAWHLTLGEPNSRLPMSAHPSIVPFQFFETADGFIAIAAPKEHFFRRLVEAIGLPELLEDDRFASFASRRTNREALLERLQARLRAGTTSMWLECLQGRVPVAPVRRMEEALDINELAERGLLAAYPHPTFGRVRAVGTPLHVTEFQPAYQPAPGLGADEHELLTQLGYEPAEIERLRSSGAFGIHT